MNPYYANWSYGYTLQPSSEATRGAYGVQYGGHGAGGGGGHHGHGQPPVPQHGASNWGQIKGRYREVCGVESNNSIDRRSVSLPRPAARSARSTSLSLSVVTTVYNNNV